MLKILIVDDDSTKIGKIMNVLRENPNINDEQIIVSLGLDDARSKLYLHDFDLLILDIQLPKAIGGNVNKDGGITLLNDIKTIEKMKKPLHIIGITSHEDSIKEYEGVFQENTWTIIECNHTDYWKTQLKNKLSYIIKYKTQITDHMLKKNYKYDIAIITAVPVEHEMVQKVIAAEWEDKRIYGDPTEYLVGNIENKNGTKLKIVTGTLLQMGMPAASVLTMKLIENFRPKLVVMVGIAAGNKGQNLNLGDIVVASESWDYGSGKLKENNDSTFVFQPAPQQIELDVEIKEKLKKNFSLELQAIKDKFMGNTPSHSLKVYVGPMASGAAVIQSEKYVNDIILNHNRKLVALEMETYGVYFAAKNATLPRPRAISIKSVCDFADSQKADDYQKYAAFTSCSFLDLLIRNNDLDL
jgi:nucleoside phosphorylase